MKVTRQFPKLLAVGLVLAMTLSSLSGCDKEEQTSAGMVSDFESQTHIQVSAPAAESTSGETISGETSDSTSKEPLSGEFVVSEKKYDYKDGNLELLYVENQTNRHCNVTIHGKYLDENGETIREETQTYICFSAGWANYFQFYPRMTFNGFSYEIETEEYVKEPLYSDENGTPLVSYLNIRYVKNMYWIRDFFTGGVEARTMVFDTVIENHHPTVSISAEYYVIVFDEQGEIYLLGTEYDDMAFGVGNGVFGTCIDPVGTGDNGETRVPTPIWMQELGQDETVPENVQGVFTAVYALIDVVDYQEYVKQLHSDGIG